MCDSLILHFHLDWVKLIYIHYLYAICILNNINTLWAFKKNKPIILVNNFSISKPNAKMLYADILDKFLHHTKQYLFCLCNNFLPIAKRNPVGLLQTERESTGKTWAGLGTQAPSIAKTLPACKNYVYFNTKWQNAIGLHLKYTKVYTFNETFIILLHANHNSNKWRNVQPIITSTIIQVSEHLIFNVQWPIFQLVNDTFWL